MLDQVGRIGDLAAANLHIHMQVISNQSSSCLRSIMHGIKISPDLVSAVTDSVIDEVTAWQARPLEPTYAIVLTLPGFHVHPD